MLKDSFTTLVPYYMVHEERCSLQLWISFFARHMRYGRMRNQSIEHPSKIFLFVFCIKSFGQSNRFFLFATSFSFLWASSHQGIAISPRKIHKKLQLLKSHIEYVVLSIFCGVQRRSIILQYHLNIPQLQWVEHLREEWPLRVEVTYSSDDFSAGVVVTLCSSP